MCKLQKSTRIFITPLPIIIYRILTSFSFLLYYVAFDTLFEILELLKPFVRVEQPCSIRTHPTRDLASEQTRTKEQEPLARVHLEQEEQEHLAQTLIQQVVHQSIKTQFLTLQLLEDQRLVNDLILVRPSCPAGLFS